MIKKLTMYVLVLATLVLFTGCETRKTDTVESETRKTDTVESETRKTDTVESEDRSYIVSDYKDPETGVHYLIYLDGYRGGITVRYNTDGTIMID